MKKEFIKTSYGIILILAFALLLLCLYLFGKPKSETLKEEQKVTELTLVYAYQNAMWDSAIEQAVTDFEESNPDVKIVAEVNYGDSVYEKILNKLIARNELGDIVQVKAPQSYVKNGIFGVIPEEVTKLISEENLYKVGEDTYAVGIVNTTSGIMYNKQIFEKYNLSEPTTYEEFLECCEVLKSHHITPIGIGGSDLWHMEFWINYYMRTCILSQNENWLSDCSEGSVAWTDSNITHMLSQLKTLFDKGYVNSDWLSTTDGSLPYLLSEGETAMAMTGPWVTAEVTALADSTSWGWFYLPDEDGQVYIGENRDTFFAISKDCQLDEEKLEAASRFLTYFYSTDNYEQVLDGITSFSTTVESISYEQDEFQTDVVDSFYGEEKHITGYVGDMDTPEGFENEMLSLIQKMLQGENSIQKTQKQLQQCWEKYQSAGEDDDEEN
ncbi:ABC transporter substrate-binding protein [Eubacterium oxidoreducens]|uniref:Raffinose/stachyose/melibiose transport system substrate-binding protein n=1 Tax=Eubacterium oxidoreducens TaxID=1732 RepID=A0A1G6B538_EUBOX|nr:extracellular solute-binding protein [Eubacterium oxidoreducens]SDB15796.1 raffinose/stachyose/melibiose transport system substrate-binding protein [Eubacterium oxidoreducens]